MENITKKLVLTCLMLIGIGIGSADIEAAWLKSCWSRLTAVAQNHRYKIQDAAFTVGTLGGLWGCYKYRHSKLQQAREQEYNKSLSVLPFAWWPTQCSTAKVFSAGGDTPNERCTALSIIEGDNYNNRRVREITACHTIGRSKRNLTQDKHVPDAAKQQIANLLLETDLKKIRLYSDITSRDRYTGFLTTSVFSPYGTAENMRLLPREFINNSKLMVRITDANAREILKDLAQHELLNMGRESYWGKQLNTLNDWEHTVFSNKPKGS